MLLIALKLLLPLVMQFCVCETVEIIFPNPYVVKPLPYLKGIKVEIK